MRYSSLPRTTWTIASLAAEAAGAVLLTACSSATTPPVTSSVPKEPAASSAPAAPSAKLSSTCTLGYDDGGTFLPATQANASAGYPTAVQVTYTGDGPGGATLTGFEITFSYNGQVVSTQNATSEAPNLPMFITPGATYTAMLDLANLSGGVYVTTQTYLGSQCSAATWFGNPSGTGAS